MVLLKTLILLLLPSVKLLVTEKENELVIPVNQLCIVLHCFQGKWGEHFWELIGIENNVGAASDKFIMVKTFYILCFSATEDNPKK